MKRKSITLILSICMVFAMIPTFVFADAEPQENDIVAESSTEQPAVEEQTVEDNLVETDTVKANKINDDVAIPNEGTTKQATKSQTSAVTFTAASVTNYSVNIQHGWPLDTKYTYSDSWGVHYGCGAPSHANYGHYGVDFGASYGASIYASANGTVIKVQRTDPGTNTYGKHVAIKHSDGTCTLYAHMSSIPSSITVGKYVTLGSVIGYVGNTGGIGQTHLHYGIYKNQAYVGNDYSYSVSGCTYDPKKYLKKYLALNVSNVTATGEPYLRWKSYPNATKYKIYAKTKSATSYTYIGYTKNRTFKHSNTNSYLAAKPTYGYQYYVKAVIGSNTKNSYSANVCCKIHRPTISSIAKPASNKFKIYFNGQKNANQYKLYWSTSKTGTYSLLYSGTIRSSVDKGGESRYFIVTPNSAVSGKTYYFKVQAVHSKWTAAKSALSEAKGAIR